MKVRVRKPVDVEIKTVRLQFDGEATTTFVDDSGDEVGVHTADVYCGTPQWFDNDHFEIDLKTGKILNWVAPTVSDLEDICQSDEFEPAESN